MVSHRQYIIDIPQGKKAYFASDQHLGAPDAVSSKKREAIFVQWLDEIKKDAEVLFLLGDLFDFWYEYKHVVPKGYIRALGKLAELSDAGIKIYFFTGNHDLWMNDYLQTELNITLFTERQTFIINNRKYLIGHGDGLGPDDKGYKRMKKVFTNPLAKKLFAWLHPDIGMALGNYLSRKNKLISGNEDIVFLGNQKEWLAQYALKKLKTEHFDYFIFGHRHLPMTIDVTENSQYINLGDWINHYTYGVVQDNAMTLERYVLLLFIITFAL